MPVIIQLLALFINGVIDFIMYWAELGKEPELRCWQVEKMQLGLQQARNNHVASKEGV